MALWAVGLITVGWVGWGYLDAHVYQQRQERLLEEALAAPPATAGEESGSANGAGETEDPTGIPADELAGAAPRGGEGGSAPATAAVAGRSDGSARSAAVTRPPARVANAGTPRGALDALGRIVVPRLGLSVMVADGVDNHTLRRAVGHIPGTSRLGSGGNVGIAGHRDGFFRPLKDVRPGDEVVVTTPGAISRYRVEWAEVVAPDDARSLEPTTYPALTLVTCYPFHYVGTAPDRFVVRARLIESRAATAADAALLAARGR